MGTNYQTLYVHIQSGSRRCCIILVARVFGIAVVEFASLANRLARDKVTPVLFFLALKTFTTTSIRPLQKQETT